ncbi:MAG: hypothetical protein J6T73_00165, partial [Clostridia bacterium]|nr:hypothetical protein [Clostridia bacterium]
VPVTVSAVPADETYEAYDVIEYADLLDTGNNHLTSSGVTLTAQNNLFHYDATSESHSVIYKFRYVAGATVYFQMFPGAYRSNDPFAYRIKDATTYEKRYSPNSATLTVSTITEGDEIDFEIARLLVATGDNAGKYYTYLKANGVLLFEGYATTDQISGTDLNDSIQLNLNGSNSCTIMASPAVIEQESADALYYYYDEIDYNDLRENGNPLSTETTLGAKTFTYNRTANTYSAILRYRWKAANTSTQFQLSFDKAGSGVDYMFGAQLYSPGAEGHTTSSIRLRPGLDDANAWNNIGYDIQTGEYYDIEFARLKVKNGANAGKYYMYFKINDVLISESYVAANIVDSEGNYTSNPGSAACHLSNEIYLTFWGGGGNDKIMKIPTPDVYDDYDEIAFSDLYVGSTPMGGTVKDGSGNYTYNATSPSYSLKLSYRWTAATEGDKKFTTYLDDWKYPFCFAVKTPNQSGFGATAGPNGSWHLVPSDDSMIVDMDEPIVGGQDYDIEVGRLKVVDGDNQGKYYVYFKVNNELIKSYYYDGVSNGTYGSSNTALSNNIIISAPAGNKFRAIPVPETYEDYDEVYYSNLMVNGNPVANERSGSGTTYTYNKTTESGSAVLKLRYIPNGTETEGQISFDRRGSNNAINYMFGIQIYKPTTEYPNGRIWLRPGYGPSVGFEEPIVPGNSYDVEFARLKVKTGINKGKYYMYFKMNGVLLAEDYVAANVVDSNGNYTSDPSSTACTISDEIYITFWGGGGATITNPAYTETYYDYDEVGYNDLLINGNPITASGIDLGATRDCTYAATSPTYSAVLKFRWTAGNPVENKAYFVLFFDEWSGNAYPF